MRAVALVLFAVITISVVGCAKKPADDTVFYIDDEYSNYPYVLSQILPGYTLELGEEVAFRHLEYGAVTEAFSPQAESALKTGVAGYWYPHFLATVIIAADRDKTPARINGWRDLEAINDPVGLMDQLGINLVSQIAAISYGLEGEAFTLKKALALLASLDSEKRYMPNSFETPVFICFDYQAAAMIRDGRNIEIIIPVEGTLTFERGLLSVYPLEFAADKNELLLAAGLRLPDGRADASLYPDAAAYSSAHELIDHEHFNNTIVDTSRDYRREVLGIRLYSGADAREHQAFALIYIAMMVIWIVSIINRVTQKGVRLAAAATGINLLCWIIIRLIKYQVPEASAFNRYLWFSFYLFQLMLPLIILWMAWVIDKQEGRVTKSPMWMRGIAAVNMLLIIMVLTNDLHGLVFKFDFSKLYWNRSYGYGFVYYIIQAGCYVPLTIGVFMMMYKGRHNLRKSGVLLILGLFGLLAAYAAGYVLRIPIAWESDFTMVVGIFTLLLIEISVRCGMIPVNTRYRKLFTHSTLSMRIIDSAKQAQAELESTSAVWYDYDTFTNALKAYPAPAQQNDDTLLFAAPITGGYALWQEDISAINRLHKDTEESISKLQTANAVLVEEGEIKRAAQEESEKTRLMALLENEIAGFTIRLSTMVEQLENAADKPKATARSMLLMCYIKRRCNLFFWEKEQDTITAGEIAMYMNEMADMAGYAGIKIIVSSVIVNQISVRHATVFYDFFYNVMYWASWIADIHIIAFFGIEGDAVTLKLLPSEGADTFQMSKETLSAAKSAGGTYKVTDLDGDYGLSLSFSMGGGGGG